MKTSTKIILAFFSFVWISLMATLLVSFKMSDQKGYSVVDKVKTDVTKLENFSVIIIEKASFLRIKNSEKNQFEYTYIVGRDAKASKNKEVNLHQIRNDTLFISRLQQAPNGGFALKVKDLKSIHVENSRQVEFIDFIGDSLNISSQNSKIVFSGESVLGHLNLTSEEYFNLSINSLEDFGLNLKTNGLKLTGEIGSLSGKMGADSFLTIPQLVGKLAIDKPSTARIVVE